ncbi:hypothetical protein Barb6_00303 [Bacteroidales bacterium Barb6]|nr:hypothetical protein Barb6_00303 [Bacteroidales bacterium Barb6]
MDFSPTYSVAECGVKGNTIREVLKGRPNNLCGTLLIIVCNLHRSLAQRAASLYVGLKSPVPFRISA